MCNKFGNSYNCICKFGYDGLLCNNSKYYDSLNVVIYLKVEQKKLLNVLYV